MDYLVTYDISTVTKDGERRLRRIAKIVEGFGVRVQFSVFELRCGKVDLARLITRIQTVIEESADSVRVYQLGSDGLTRVLELGRNKTLSLDEPWIL